MGLLPGQPPLSFENCEQERGLSRQGFHCSVDTAPLNGCPPAPPHLPAGRPVPAARGGRHCGAAPPRRHNGRGPRRGGPRRGRRPRRRRRDLSAGTAPGPGPGAASRKPEAPPNTPAGGCGRQLAAGRPEDPDAHIRPVVRAGQWSVMDARWPAAGSCISSGTGRPGAGGRSVCTVGPGRAGPASEGPDVVWSVGHLLEQVRGRRGAAVTATRASAVGNSESAGPLARLPTARLPGRGGGTMKVWLRERACACACTRVRAWKGCGGANALAQCRVPERHAMGGCSVCAAA
jgi:hypothetical protein